jgi:MATE family multidrug resistance protein
MLLSYKTHFKNTIRLSIPVIIGQLGLVMMSFFDNLMVGNLGGQMGHVYLSASTLANSLFFLIVVVSMGVGFAMPALVSESKGAKKPDAHLGEILMSGFWAGLIVSVISAVLVVISVFTLPYMGQPLNEIRLAQEYLVILSVSTPPLILFVIYKGLTDGVGDTKIGMYSTLFGLFGNIFLNWLFIFGHWGFPELKLNGAGIATVITRYLMLFGMMYYVHNRSKYKSFFTNYRWHFQWKPVYEFLKLGIPMGLQFFFEVAAFSGTSIMLGALPVDASVYRAAHQIALGTASVTFMFCTGISNGSSILVGNYYGQNDWENCQRAGFTGILTSLVAMLLFSVLLLVFRYEIAHFFKVENVKVYEIAPTLLIMAAAFQIFDGVQATSAGTLRGIQDVKFPTIATFIGYWLFSLPLSYFLCFPAKWGVYGIWVSYIATLAIMSLVLSWRFWKRIKLA